MTIKVKLGGGVLNYQLVNDYLTSIFNNVLVIEESSLRASRFKDVSIEKMLANYFHF